MYMTAPQVWARDTLTIDVSAEHVCGLFGAEGSVTLELGAGAVFDVAGNAFQGNSDTGEAWVLQGNPEACSEAKARKDDAAGGGGSAGIAVGCVVAVGLLGIGGFFAYKRHKTRLAAEAYGMLETSAVPLSTLGEEYSPPVIANV